MLSPEVQSTLVSTVIDLKQPLEDFLAGAASKTPVPGGGSTAALAGALAASMAEMVLNYSVNKKSLEHYQSELKPALEKVHEWRLALQQLVVDDQVAYQSVASLRKLRRESPEYAAQWDKAVLEAIKVPQAVMNNCVLLLELCDSMVNFVNPHLLSDLAVASDLAMAAGRCAVYNVRSNLPDIGDDASRTRIASGITEALMRASMVIQRISPRIWERVEQETK